MKGHCVARHEGLICAGRVVLRRLEGRMEGWGRWGFRSLVFFSLPSSFLFPCSVLCRYEFVQGAPTILLMGSGCMTGWKAKER